MNMKQLEALLDPVKEISYRAGQAIMEVYGTDFKVEEKADDSPLTRADLAAHQIITEGLHSLTPDLPQLCEEAADIPYAQRQDWRRYWLIDPLDGTREFIKRNGEFTVNIALIENHKPVLGVVYVPFSQTYYFATAGHGAFEQAHGAQATAIHTRPADPKALIAVASRSHMTPEVQAYLAKLGEPEITSIGSSLKICLVAQGKADIYPRLGLTSEWDTAAAQAVLEVAGGALVDLQGRPLLYNTKESLLNPYFLAYGDPRHDWTAYLT
jgi:3'(2'), 5'-bisphosphate nucleotidase